MSRETLTTIVSRVITDQDYREQFFADPDSALAGYELSESEEQLLRRLNADAFDELTMDLEVRQSKSGFLGNISLIGGKDAVDVKTILDLLTNKYGGLGS
ncbi:MAG: hypothetical protein GYB65_10095 [Chloroflexi bacterium]|nr:hypothetical protein [Chloroflexota bacterium]